jgi:colanic acid/amylovoran biosynthesis glycosyltransferase
LDDPGPDAPSAEWAGASELVKRPPLHRGIRDLCWWLTHHPARTFHFVVAVIREPGRRGYALRRAPTLARHLRAQEWPHVHAHFVWNTATVAAGIARLLDVPSTITVHAKDIYAQRPSTVRRRLALFDALVTVCHFNVGYMTGAKMIPRHLRPRVVCCGVARCEETAGGPSRCDIVTVGRLVDKKGIDVLLHAIALLRPQVRATLRIVGDGPERGSLEALAEELGLADQVTFVGALAHQEALETIRTGRLFCLASRPTSDADSDAMPVVIREAMALGVPVVATRLAGIPESVDEQVGWLVDPGSATALAAALQEALGNRDDAALRGEAGRDRAVTRWSFATQSRDLRDVFGSVAS